MKFRFKQTVTVMILVIVVVTAVSNISSQRDFIKSQTFIQNGKMNKALENNLSILASKSGAVPYTTRIQLNFNNGFIYYALGKFELSANCFSKYFGQLKWIDIDTTAFSYYISSLSLSGDPKARLMKWWKDYLKGEYGNRLMIILLPVGFQFTTF